MGLPDDYSDGMARSSSDEALVVERIRASLLRAPAPEVAAAHLAAMAGAAVRNAPPSELGERGNTMRTFTRKRALVLAAVASMALGAGLAAAVTLPDRASDRAWEVQAAKAAKAHGQEVPAVQSSAHGQAVSGVARDDSTEGCEHGRAVSGMASTKAADNRNADGPGHDPCEKSRAGGIKAAKVKTGPRGKALGHGEPPGKRVGQTDQAGGRGKGKSATGGSSGVTEGTTAGSTGETTGTTDGGSASDTTSPSPEPEPSPTTEPSPTAEPSPTP